MKIISTEIEIESAKKKSSTALGSGTMMIARMATMMPTMLRLLNLTIGARNGATRVKILFFCFANFTS